MAKVGAQRAAELTGKSKSTIQRSMNSGKISFELDANGRRLIDVSELERVFGVQQNNAGAGSNNMPSVEEELRKASSMLEIERLQMRIKMLEDQIHTANEQISDLKEQRDQWQKQAQQVLITSQYSQQQAEELKAELRERDERAKAQRQKMLDERMKRMQGQGQNQNAAQQRPTQQQAQTPAQGTSAQSAEAGSGIDFQGLWKKIKGDKAA